jgi:hypothetical protein
MTGGMEYVQYEFIAFTWWLVGVHQHQTSYVGEEGRLVIIILLFFFSNFNIQYIER